MPKKDARSVKLPRPYNHAELQQFASQLNSLAEEFDDHTKRLRTSDASLVPIAGIRAAMARAGRMVADLVQRNALVAIQTETPWLTWFGNPSRHPQVSRWQGAPNHWSWSPPLRLGQLLQLLAARPQVLARDQTDAPSDRECEDLHARLVFVEAVAGWLGRRCTPKLRVSMPVGRAFTEGGAAVSDREAKHVLVTIDWDGRPLDQSKLMFFELGPACAAACRYAADAIIDSALAHPATVTGRLNDAIAEWQRHTLVVAAQPSGTARMILNLSALSPWPEDGVATQGIALETDPSPSAATLLRAANDPGVHEFARISNHLAEACGDIASEFDRHKIDLAPALQLKRELLKSPRLPTVLQADLVQKVSELADVLDVRTTRKDGPTVFEITTSWMASFDAWHRYVQNWKKDGREMRLCLPEVPTEEHPTTATAFALSPTPEGAYKQQILNHRKFALYAAAARDFADRTEPVIGALRRFGESVEAAHTLLRHLRTPNLLPTFQDYESSFRVKHQLQRVDSIIWRGVLADDEDVRERAAFWATERTTLVTQDALDRFDELVGQIMKRPRDPEHETAVLNHASRLRQQETFTVPLSEILSQPTPDVVSKCEQWIALAGYGIRFFSRRSTNHPEVQTIDFSSSVAANNLYPSSATEGPDVRWAKAMVEATKAARPLAAATGMGAETLLAFTRLELDFERILKGETVDIGQHLKEVQVLVKAAVDSTPRNGPAVTSVSPSQPPSAEAQTQILPMLTGWPDILSSIGMSPKSRRHRDLISRLNDRTNGPIHRVSRVPTAAKANLLAWWVEHQKTHESLRDAPSDQNRSASRAELDDPQARIKQGIHKRTGPNRNERRRSS